MNSKSEVLPTCMNVSSMTSIQSFSENIFSCSSEISRYTYFSRQLSPPYFQVAEHEKCYYYKATPSVTGYLISLLTQRQRWVGKSCIEQVLVNNSQKYLGCLICERQKGSNGHTHIIASLVVNCIRMQ